MKANFRSAMFGFNKEDVFQFITKQNRQFEAKMQEFSLEKDGLETQWNRRREELEEKCADLEKKLEQGEHLREKFVLVKDRVSQLSSDFASLRICYEKCDAARNSSRILFDEMKEKALRAEHLQEKADKFDQLSGVLTSILGGEKKADSTSSSSVVDGTTENTDFPFDGALEELQRFLNSLEEHLELLKSEAGEEL